MQWAQGRFFFFLDFSAGILLVEETLDIIQSIIHIYRTGQEKIVCLVSSFCVEKTDIVIWIFIVILIEHCIEAMMSRQDNRKFGLVSGIFDKVINLVITGIVEI